MAMTEYSKIAPDYEVLCSAMRKLKEGSESVKIFPMGKSVLGRRIFVIGLGKLRSATVYVGGVHGQEWLTVNTLLEFAFSLCRCYEGALPLGGVDVRAALNSKGVLLVPCLNPDGVEIALHGKDGAGERADFVDGIACGDYRGWQANARGVDLNHNFDAGFETLRQMEREAGIVGPAPRQYGGETAMSEPETRAIASLCRLFDAQKLFAFHSQGEEIFYQYGEHTPTQSRLMAEILARSSGYRLVLQEGLASHGGLKDWFIDTFRRPGFTVEIGKGKNPLPIDDFPAIYEKIAEMLMLGLLL